MKLNQPRFIVWVIALVLAVLGVIFLLIPAVKPFAFWVELVGLALMLVATGVKGL